MGSYYGSSSTKGLRTSQLGGVIFGCNETTINECLFKKLFGLPSSHFDYVKKIEPGLPLFLFNYTDRTLLGIFEAASSGQMNIDPCAWTCEGNTTPFPAQVQIRVTLQCKVLTENQFKPIIVDNYHTSNHFSFELDHAQTTRLLSLMAPLALSCPRSTPAPNHTTKQRTFFPSMEVVSSHSKSAKSLPINIKQANTFNTGKDVIRLKLKELALNRRLMPPSPPADKIYVWPKVVGQPPHSVDRKGESNVSRRTMEKKEDSLSNSSKTHPMIPQLISKVKELLAFKAMQKDRINHLEEKAAFLQQNLAEAQAEIKKLKTTRDMSKIEICVGPDECIDLKVNEVSLVEDRILLVGGFDFGSWLSSLDCYSPSQNSTKSLNPMTTARCDAAVSKLDGEIFVYGGGASSQWFDTVESYDPVSDRWTTCPPLSRKNGSLAGATLNDKIYAIGGGNGVDCYSNVEMLDFDVGSWIPSRSMLEKRFALAAAELNGALYSVGGFDGTNYLRTAERFDPRERSWTKIESMSSTRGCPSMVVFNEKLYVLGGYDGSEMVSTIEIYDPRRGSWVLGEPMNHPRGFSAAAVAKDSIYVIGGVKNGDEIHGTVECYKEGQGWEMTNTNDAFRRCFFSAVAL